MGTLLKIMSASLVTLFLSASLSYGETVKIIAEDAWYPYSGHTDNGVAGITVDLVTAIYKAEGIDVVFDEMNYDRCLAELEGGKAVGCFNVARTKETENVYLWTEEPMFVSSTSYFTKADYQGSIRSVKDLAGKKVGLTQGYQYGDDLDLNTDVQKEYSKDDEIIIKKLLAGRVDVIVLWEAVADYLISKNNVRDKVKKVGVLQSSGLYTAFSKKNPDGKKYCDIFSRGLKKIKENGTYQKIFDDWAAKLKGSQQETKPEENLQK